MFVLITLHNHFLYSYSSVYELFHVVSSQKFTNKQPGTKIAQYFIFLIIPIIFCPVFSDILFMWISRLSGMSLKDLDKSLYSYFLRWSWGFAWHLACVTRSRHHTKISIVLSPARLDMSIDWVSVHDQYRSDARALTPEKLCSKWKYENLLGVYFCLYRIHY